MMLWIVRLFGPFGAGRFSLYEPLVVTADYLAACDQVDRLAGGIL